MTEINDVIACFRELLFIESSPKINLKFYLSYWVILNMSLLINYSTKFLRSSGAICKAFILKERSIYIIPYIIHKLNSFGHTPPPIQYLTLLGSGILTALNVWSVQLLLLLSITSFNFKYSLSLFFPLFLLKN